MVVICGVFGEVDVVVATTGLVIVEVAGWLLVIIPGIEEVIVIGEEIVEVVLCTSVGDRILEEVVEDVVVVDVKIMVGMPTVDVVLLVGSCALVVGVNFTVVTT